MHLQAKKTMSSVTFNIPALIQRWPWPVLLVWSCLLLLPVGRLVELPTTVMAIIAGRLWYRCHLHPLANRYRIFTLAFFLIWLPMAISLTDAVNPTEALRVTTLYLRFYFAGLFIIWAIDNKEKRNLLLRLTAWLLLFWAADAIIQFIFGTDLFGYPYIEQRLNGLFGRHIKLGLILAMLSPFIISWVQEGNTKRGAALFLAAVVFVIIASGTRASWVMFGVVSVAYLVNYLRAHKDRAPKLIALIIIASISTGYLTYRFVPTITARVDQTLQLFSGDAALMDRALSYRLPIWEGALKMIEDHPVNGVGVRDFRSAYTTYATPGDFYVAHNTTPMHPHQYILEIGAETGLIGLGGLLLFYTSLIQRWRSSSPSQRNMAYFIMVSLIAVWFPLNTHLAFYSSFMGQVVWWVTALYFAMTSIPVPEKKPHDGSIEGA